MNQILRFLALIPAFGVVAMLLVRARLHFAAWRKTGEMFRLWVCVYTVCVVTFIVICPEVVIKNVLVGTSPLSWHTPALFLVSSVCLVALLNLLSNEVKLFMEWDGRERRSKTICLEVNCPSRKRPTKGASNV